MFAEYTHVHVSCQKSHGPALQTLIPHMHVPPTHIFQLLVITPWSDRPFEPQLRDLDEASCGNLVFHVYHLLESFSKGFAGVYR